MQYLLNKFGLGGVGGGGTSVFSENCVLDFFNQSGNNKLRFNQTGNNKLWLIPHDFFSHV